MRVCCAAGRAQVTAMYATGIANQEKETRMAVKRYKEVLAQLGKELAEKDSIIQTKVT